MNRYQTIERERGRQTDRQRQTDRETETEGQRERDTEKQRETRVLLIDAFIALITTSHP